MKRTVTLFNLWVLFLGLVSLNANPQTYLDQLFQKNLAQTKYIEYNHFASTGDENYANSLDGLGISLHSADGSTQEGKPDLSSLNHCKSLVYRALQSLPSEDVSQLKNLTLSFDPSVRRGLGGGSTIILRCASVSDEELVGVLVHEMGHITDTGLLNGSADAGESEFLDGSNPIYNNDPSLDFYRLDFISEKSLKVSASPQDFVSGYAMTDAFEDFAETYNYYVLHGDEFRILKAGNEILQKKYEFLKIRVFKGKEFYNGDSVQKVNMFERDYDTTVLHYDMNKFFVI